MMNFATAITLEIVSSLSNCYEDNYDYYRFGKAPVERRAAWIKECLKKYLYQKTGFIKVDLTSVSSIITKYEDHICNCGYLYNLLSDEKSQKMLVKLLAYRILGHKLVKLPTNNDDFWTQVRLLENLADHNDSIDIKFNNWLLYRYNLRKIGIPLELYYSALGVYVEFLLKQYEYHTPEVEICVQKGDVVIDAGGCFGDTALSFANATGENGRVYTFEFIPSHLKIMKKNISLNPTLERTISIVDRPLWSEPDKKLFFFDSGPGSRVSLESDGNSSQQVTTLSIDGWVEKGKIGKVDFIKMDIEGAELPALIGAEQTIRRHRPKLAIAIYHRLEDFKEIPEYIDSLNLGYKYYLGHYTIHNEETVIFAIV